MVAPDFRYARSFRQARHSYLGHRRKVRLLVLHSAESLERHDSAEGIQSFFLTNQRPASAHVTWDDDSCAQSVRLGDTAFGAKGANADAIHFEHAGRARQTRAEWLDDYGTSMLIRSAIGAAAVCQQFGLPVTFLRAKQLAAGASGITTHAEISKWITSSGHWDPGPGFPVDWYLGRVREAMAGRLTMHLDGHGKLVLGRKPDTLTWEQPFQPMLPSWARVLRVMSPAMTGNDVRAVQIALKLPVTGRYDRATATAVARWKKATFGTAPSDPNARLVGEFTAKKLGIVP